MIGYLNGTSLLFGGSETHSGKLRHYVVCLQRETLFEKLKHSHADLRDKCNNILVIFNAYSCNYTYMHEYIDAFIPKVVSGVLYIIPRELIGWLC